MKARYARGRAEDMRERALRCRARLERGCGSGKEGWEEALAVLIDREKELAAQGSCGGTERWRRGGADEARQQGQIYEAGGEDGRGRGEQGRKGAGGKRRR